MHPGLAPLGAVLLLALPALAVPMPELLTGPGLPTLPLPRGCDAAPRLVVDDGSGLVLAGDEALAGAAVQGTGTAEDPYVIAGLVMVRPPGTPGFLPLLHVIGTSAHAIICGSSFDGPQSTVTLEAARNLAFAGNRLVGAAGAVTLYRAEGVRVAGNDIVASGFVAGPWGGVFVWESRGVLAEGNHVAVRGAIGRSGVLVYDSTDTMVRGNTLLSAGGSTFLDLRGTGVAVVADSPGTLVTGNDLGRVHWGVWNRGEAPVDARGNWWGCPDGPGHPGCSDPRGDVAWSPWLTLPRVLPKP